VTRWRPSSAASSRTWSGQQAGIVSDAGTRPI
jgi:hypothetical protein